MGKVYLVGAGPGNPKLITLRGIELIKDCDAIIYDRLSSFQLLDYLKPNCEKIYVGKQAGHHYKKQEEINSIIIECAKKYENIVRLKGGDSFVFGRGGEEIEAMEEYDIEYEVIPGVTSAVAVPESAGIPVTHRGASRSFHVITGHTNTASGEPECDYEALARMEGTLVFLMGLTNLSNIVSNLVKCGKSELTPAAVISEGTTNKQCVVRATLENIVDEVAKSEIVSPAIIVIGETAKYNYRYNKEEKLDIRVGITATSSVRKKLEKGFGNLGVNTFTMCNMDIVKTDGISRLNEEILHINEYKWVLFTSQNGVEIFFEQYRILNKDIRDISNIRFATLGSGTANKLEEYGIHSDFIPSKYTVSVLAEEFADIVQPSEKILIPRAAQGSRELNAVFDERGLEYTDLAIYDIAGELSDNIDMLDAIDLLVFVSSSGVRAFFEGLRKANITLPSNVKIACIGEVTGEAIKSENIEADIVATTNDVNGLVESIKEYFAF